MKTLKHLLENNKKWSEKVKRQMPDFFTDLAKQQNPEYVWIGCSDSRVSASNIVGLMPGEVFVHRNIANLVIHTDMNCLSVLQFAVEVLQVKHIIVCGHYGCGGVKAALENQRHGLIDNWLRHIQDTANLYAEILSQIESDEEKLDKLCELNVIEQVVNVAETTIVQDAWERGQTLRVHGWIYDLKDGIIDDLGVHLENRVDTNELRKEFLEKTKHKAVRRTA
ncbi:MAG TPA: carbonate dehydratase [Pyrinomonadaceae bacterium]|nr:carbonate dehydratase [Pyrinomonadaceae bacterium]